MARTRRDNRRKEKIKFMALNDDDLEPLRDEIKRL